MRLVRVVIGIIKKHDLFLIAKRPATVVMPGYWEFPGGKIEVEERDLDALIRELNEEIGITVHKAEYLAQFNHPLEDRRIELNVWLVKEYTGTAHGKEEQEIRWVTTDEFTEYQFLPSNDFLLHYLTEAQLSGIV